ncbi:MAG: fatty acid CoA ligase family protein [Bacteroidales bacterium]|jgi:acyl-CoA synthetase (AMP-forming)/AMP-acid ligase II|nr:fatty acid CoA ligase family protein [Bacteroidales bacterium]
MLTSDQHINASEINNISDYLKLNAEKSPDKPAILSPEKITYKELENKVNALSFGLSQAGLKAGTRTLVLVPAGTNFFVLIFSLLRIGAVPVMIDPGMGIKAMLTVLADLEAEAFIGIPKAHLFFLLFPHAFKTVKIKITTGMVSLKGTKRLNSLRIDNNRPFPSYSGNPQDMAVIFFTSGSTGPAKGAIYTAGMLKNQIEVTRSRFKIGSNVTDLCTFPLLGLFAICHGNSSVIADMDMMHPAKMDPEKVIRNIYDFGCTQMFGSPMILNKLSSYCQPRNIKLPTLMNIISAGAAVPGHILESFSRLVPDDAVIHTPYGATEALPVTDVTASELLKIYSENHEYENVICIGRPIEPLDVKIIEITDKHIESWGDAKLMDVNEVGEIVVSGPWVSKGYYRKPDADRLSKIQDLSTHKIWHRMGDLGKIDSSGKIWFYGRKSHRVITHKGTLFTIPCEAVFNRHPLVSRSALVGININDTGFKKPVICIQLLNGIKANPKIMDELKELGKMCNITKNINDILFKKEFPVDPRHNAKIFREKLALWASKKIK